MSQKSQPNPSSKVKREGWVNIYPPKLGGPVAWVGNVYATKSEADSATLLPGCFDCIRIEWEEPADPEAQTTAPAIVFYPAGSLGAMQGEE